MTRWPVFSLLFLVMFVASSQAHEVRPAMLHLTQLGDQDYAVLWKVPARGDAVLKLTLQFPETCTPSTPKKIVRDTASVVQRWKIRCTEKIAGQRLAVEGLETTAVEMIGQIDWLGRSPQSVRLTGGANAFELSTRATWADVATSYGPFGFTHIWEGWDHLLFLTALMLLVRSVRQILWAVTSFTIAHSITLALAVLQIVHVPSGLVETMIALSIVFVAAEAMRSGTGVKTLAIERPWLVSFAFGLLHGLGFAGALTDAGLPPTPSARLWYSSISGWKQARSCSSWRFWPCFNSSPGSYRRGTPWPAARSCMWPALQARSGRLNAPSLCSYLLGLKPFGFGIPPGRNNHAISRSCRSLTRMCP